MNVNCDVFLKSKKLELQVKNGKCQFIHVGQDQCSSKQNDNELLETDAAKYLADSLSSDGYDLFCSRIDQATAYASQCLTMISYICLGYSFYSISKLHMSYSYSDLHGSAYFYDARFTTDSCNVLFMFRCRMYGVKGNFRNKYVSQDLNCPFDTCSEIDTQENLLKCNKIKQYYLISPDVVYEDIFSENVENLLSAGQALLQLIETRKKDEEKTCVF